MPSDGRKLQTVQQGFSRTSAAPDCTAGRHSVGPGDSIIIVGELFEKNGCGTVDEKNSDATST